MSFIDDIKSFANSATTWLGGSGFGPTLAKTALTGFALSQLSRSINRQNTNQTPESIRLQQDPNTENSIPVVYGEAYLGGLVTDAVLTNSNQTMYICIAICEKTGLTNLGSGADSVISFRDIYWNNQQLVFQSDGITVNYSVDVASGQRIDDLNGIMRIYCYNNGSASPVVPEIYTNGSLSPAYSIMPNWTSNHTMDNLVFVIASIDYNREKNLTNIGKFEFRIKNTMEQPGDCLYDYMTNTRYGAGISSSEIYIS